jgi:DNA-binding MarR family transcriptional regulator
MDKPSMAEELRGALEGDRYQILECLTTHDELSSSEIRDLAEIPDGSTHYQLTLLESWGLIKPVGTRYMGEYDTGIPATIYTLTEKGHTVVAER